MATGIPMPGAPGDSLLKGLDTGSGMFTRIMQPILQRENMAREWQQHLNQLEIQKQQQGRLGAMMPYQIQAMQDAHEASVLARDPEAQFALIQKMMGMGRQPSAVQGQEEMTSSPVPSYSPPSVSGGDGWDPQDIIAANQQQTAPQAQVGIGAPAQNSGLGDMSALQKAFIKKFTGMDVDAESPSQKRFADLQVKLELENRKTKNKEEALKTKELMAVKKDLPTLEKSLKGVNEMIDIAKNNPDMFGHGFMPDLYAKTSKNKNFGKWQNLISDAIAGLEQKLSSRGNIVALKMAAQLKPSHGEQQDVAIGKLESMQQQLQDAVARSKQLTGDKKVAPDGGSPIDVSKMSDEDLMKIISGGQ